MFTDKKTLDMLLTLPDDMLCRMLKMLTSGNGPKLGTGEPDRETVAGLRAVLSQVTERDLERAEELLKVYKKAGKEGGHGA
ncbi:MAG: hypothetical protein MJ096_01100 [Clostridia bacterium]|nr:hypothetical protein [Clostridia bacterium]